MSHWWSSKQELILMQIWVVLILSHVVYASIVNASLRHATVIRLRCRYPCWWTYCPSFVAPEPLSLEQLVRSGRQLGRLASEPTSQAQVYPR
jgi:hypothetical protein